LLADCRRDHALAGCWTALKKTGRSRDRPGLNAKTGAAQ
jgi:hypothetical protein